jgi:hypothetical protein
MVRPPPARALINFDTPEESERAFAILTEADPFRLVIRGHALVEDVLARAIDAAFREGTPAELRRLRLPARCNSPIRHLTSSGGRATIEVFLTPGQCSIGRAGEGPATRGGGPLASHRQS